MTTTTEPPVGLAGYRQQRADTARLEAMPSADDERLTAAWASAVTTDARAAAICRHPDLAERLAALGFADPRQWNGFIPPRMWGEALNTSPRRRALVEICAEAQRRAGGE